MSASPATVAVTLDDVRHVANLANLELTAEELPRMVRDLNAVLGHIAQLNELDTKDIAPMAQVRDVLGRTPSVAEERLRADAIKPSLNRSEVMDEAPESDGRFFKVPKVIER